MALKNAKDHWAFLEEIEAPMWVDLALDAKSSYQDNVDEWFHASHAFHQYSSQKLKAAFSECGEGTMSSDFGLKGPSSPKLPSSVSRSRGKHYASKKWRGEDCVLPLNKQHPVKVLNGKSSWMKLESSEEIKPKLSFINSRIASGSKMSLVSERSLTENANQNDLKGTSSYGGLESRSSSMVYKTGESNTSTITSESDKQAQQRNVEVSSQAFGHTSGLLLAMRISLRKSCVTRKASRVEVDKRRQSRDRKSLSGKSSVGSSSNTGYDVKSSTCTLMRKKEKTPDSRNVKRVTVAAKKKVRDSSVSKAFNIQVNEGIQNSRKSTGTLTKSAHQEAVKSQARSKKETLGSRNVARTTTGAKKKVKGTNASEDSNVKVNEGIQNSRRSISNLTKSAHQEAAKSKVQNQSLCAKVLLPHRINEQDTLFGPAKIKEKVRMGDSNRLVGGGKENPTGRLSVSKKGSTADMTRGQKGTNQNVPRNTDREGLVGPKGKTNSQSKGKYPTNMSQRVYFR